MCLHDTFVTPPSCTAGVDFSNSSLSNEITFFPGEVSRCANVMITDDNVLEVSEIFSVQVSANDSGVVIGSPSSASVMILDNDGRFNTLQQVSIVDTMYDCCNVFVYSQ